MAWALFDLDDTVLDHDSFGRFTVHLLRRNPLRAAGAVALAPVIAALFARRAWRIHAASLLLWVGTVGLGDARLDRLVHHYLDRLAVMARVRPGAAQALAKHFAAGEGIVVLTACAELLAVPLCRAIDPRIRVVGSTLTRRWGGLLALRHCHGEEKPAMLAESGVDGDIAAAYTDSSSDIPMLNLAPTAVLVNVPEPTADRIRARLTGPGVVEVVHWPPRQEGA
jgi:phosphatidylglycerophosphatase C